jgi:hypothetical protein
VAEKETSYATDVVYDENFAKTLMRENRFIFLAIFIGLVAVLGFLGFSNSPGQVKARQEQTQQKVLEEQKAEEARKASEARAAQTEAESAKREALMYSPTQSGEATVRIPERTGTPAVDDIIFSMRNSAYTIMNAVSDKIVQPGDSLDTVKTKVPTAFEALPNVGISIFYDPATPAQFSMCGISPATSNSSLETSVLYDSRVDSFKSGIFNCSSSNSSLAAPAVDMKVTNADTLTKSILKPSVFEALQPKQSAGPVNNDNTDVSPIVTPKNLNEIPSESKIATPAEPISWGPIIFGFLILIGISVLSFIGFKIHGASNKAAESKRERNENLVKWQNVINRHDSIVKDWASYELNPSRILDLPLMSDMREPATLEFHRAMRVAKNLKPSDLKTAAYKSPLDSDYSKAVDSLEDAFSVAEVEAKRVRWDKFSTAEKKRLQTAKNLLNLAMDGSATDAERQSAYKRMQKELEGLIVMPKATVLALEKKVNLSLTDGKEELLSV